MKRLYWDGKTAALICFYCKHYNSFPSVEELKTHIQAVHKGDKRK